MTFFFDRFSSEDPMFGDLQRFYLHFPVTEASKGFILIVFLIGCPVRTQCLVTCTDSTYIFQ